MKEVKQLIEKSRKFIRSAKLLLETGDYESAVSRAYYTMFYCAQALLIRKGIICSTHKGVISEFGKVFIKEGILPKELGKAINKAFMKRQLSDYSCEEVITKKDAEQSIQDAEVFLIETTKYLSGGAEMAYETLLVEKKDNIAIVTINRPKVLNALNKTVIEELEKCFKELQNDPEVGAVILTGAGDKAFVAGADISGLVELNPLEGKEFAEKGQAVFNLIENLGKPVIAAINGYALGGGCELAMACTIRIASEKAKLGQPEVNLGIIPGYGGTQRLPRLIGKGRAMELILTGRMVDAQEAYQMGLVNKVVPPEKLMDEAIEMAKTILSKGPLAVKYAMEAVNRGLEVSLEEGLRIEADLFGICCATEDKVEGTKAFLEKRKPNFQGK